MGNTNDGPVGLPKEVRVTTALQAHSDRKVSARDSDDAGIHIGSSVASLSISSEARWVALFRHGQREADEWIRDHYLDERMRNSKPANKERQPRSVEGLPAFLCQPFESHHR